MQMVVAADSVSADMVRGQESPLSDTPCYRSTVAVVRMMMRIRSFCHTCLFYLSSNHAVSPCSQPLLSAVITH